MQHVDRWSTKNLEVMIPAKLARMATQVGIKPVSYTQLIEQFLGPGDGCMKSPEDVARMLGPNALYISMGEAGEDVVIMGTVGSVAEVSRMLITLGKLLRKRSS